MGEFSTLVKFRNSNYIQYRLLVQGEIITAFWDRLKKTSTTQPAEETHPEKKPDPCKDQTFTPRFQQKKINVFVSSTFRDMIAERDELTLRVFPALRKVCEERGIAWGEVDLRWGIPEDKSETGETLGICLEYIEKCRPYFIGMLGERYGWVDPDGPERVKDDHHRVKEKPDRSITSRGPPRVPPGHGE